jgi:hypothetical protein
MSGLRAESSANVKSNLRNTYSFGTPIDITLSVAVAETVGIPRNENSDTFFEQGKS